MVLGTQRPAVLDTQAEHAAHVLSVGSGLAPADGFEEFSTSWERSAHRYRVDPADPHAPHIFTPQEIQARREPLAGLIETAREEIDALYRRVRRAGYVLLFCDPGGVAIEHRGDDRASDAFRYWGTWLGGLWAEDAEGTNGIGTCIAEQRPITVHRSQHFRSRNKDLSCSGAPIFDERGRLAAVLDVSAIDPQLSESAHALTGVLTQASARAIEERLFRARFHRDWIVALASPDRDVQGVLLAVSVDQRIIGADRAARASFMLDDAKLQAGISLWSIFERDPAPFRQRCGDDLPARFVLSGSRESCVALVTSPDQPRPASPADLGQTMHLRPRFDLLASLSPSEALPQARGGLPGGVMRRVRDYIEANLSENIDLPTLASIAGISVFHFARQFKVAAGITPHDYLIARRVERARELLARDDRSIAEIALTTGFSDQSHFARCFREHMAMTPREFRRSLR